MLRPDINDLIHAFQAPLDSTVEIKVVMAPDPMPAEHAEAAVAEIGAAADAEDTAMEEGEALPAHLSSGQVEIIAASVSCRRMSPSHCEP